MLGEYLLPDGTGPFILIARITVNQGKVDEYLDIAAQADKAVERSEPGMLFHNFDADPNDPCKFVWSEIYRQSDDFITHANNPPVQEYIKKHDDLANHFSIEIYGNVSENVINKINDMGVPFQHFKTTDVGYIRKDYFNK